MISSKCRKFYFKHIENQFIRLDSYRNRTHKEKTLILERMLHQLNTQAIVILDRAPTPYQQQQQQKKNLSIKMNVPNILYEKVHYYEILFDLDNKDAIKDIQFDATNALKKRSKVLNRVVKTNQLHSTMKQKRKQVKQSSIRKSIKTINCYNNNNNDDDDDDYDGIVTSVTAAIPKDMPSLNIDDDVVPSPSSSTNLSNSIVDAVATSSTNKTNDIDIKRNEYKNRINNGRSVDLTTHINRNNKNNNIHINFNNNNNNNNNNIINQQSKHIKCKSKIFSYKPKITINAAKRKYYLESTLPANKKPAKMRTSNIKMIDSNNQTEDIYQRNNFHYAKNNANNINNNVVNKSYTYNNNNNNNNNNNINNNNYNHSLIVNADIENYSKQLSFDSNNINLPPLEPSFTNNNQTVYVPHTIYLPINSNDVNDGERNAFVLLPYMNTINMNNFLPQNNFLNNSNNNTCINFNNQPIYDICNNVGITNLTNINTKQNHLHYNQQCQQNFISSQLPSLPPPPPPPPSLLHQQQHQNNMTVSPLTPTELAIIDEVVKLVDMIDETFEDIPSNICQDDGHQLRQSTTNSISTPPHSPMMETVNERKSPLLSVQQHPIVVDTFDYNNNKQNIYCDYDGVSNKINFDEMLHLYDEIN